MKDLITGFITLSVFVFLLLAIICTVVEEVIIKNNSLAIVYLTPFVSIVIMGIVFVIETLFKE